MTHCILRISGTFGSGKTTAARGFLKYPHQEMLGSDGKLKGYKIDAGLRSPVFLLGSYRNVCGGCDGIPTQAEIANRVLRAHPAGHVLYEGALVSGAGLAGAVTMATQPTGCSVYAFLDTPLELCIERVKGRREAAGNDKPFNPKNTIQKFDSVVGTYKALRKAECDVRMIDYTNPHPALFAILQEFDNAA